jgi:hypothetical protein
MRIGVSLIELRSCGASIRSTHRPRKWLNRSGSALADILPLATESVKEAQSHLRLLLPRQSRHAGPELRLTNAAIGQIEAWQPDHAAVEHLRLI